MSSNVLSLYRKLQRWPGGQWLFARLVCFKAPYFGSIAPRITALEPGLCRGQLRHRRAVNNHIGTVHAIALCNLAELVMGLMVDVSTPPGMRWIPKGMQVSYLGKARGTITATAHLGEPMPQREQGYELPVEVVMTDPQDQVVCTAVISCWISPRRKQQDSAAPSAQRQ
jgi:acyl-coenzyme A thioesterase PaaI-like protein